VVIFLDGKQVTKEELEKPLSLSVGEHTLKIERKDGSVVTRMFTVGKEDTTIQVAGESKPEKPIEPIPTEPSEAVKPLIKKLTDEDVRVRRQAAASLETLKDRSAVPALVARVADSQWVNDDWYESNSSKSAALRALRALAPGHATPALLDALKSKTEEVRHWSCLQLKAQKDDAKAVAGLVASLKKDPAPKVRVAAAASLVAARPPAVEALVGALTHDDVRVRTQAAVTLAALGDSAVPPDVVKQVADGSAAALARRIADDRWVNDDWYESNSSKSAALRALRALAPGHATPALLDALKSKTEEVRHWSCIQLGNQKDQASLDGLDAATNDPAPKVREAAAAALRKRKK
jgi:HEAT repeat protein